EEVSRQQIMLERTTGHDRTLEDAGASGMLAIGGFYLQTWTLDEWPDVATYQGLRPPRTNAQHFAWDEETVSVLQASPETRANWTPSDDAVIVGIYSDYAPHLPTWDPTTCANMTCAVPTLVVQKVVTSKLSDWNQYTVQNEDINSYLADSLVMDDRAAACKWLTENRKTWEPWLWFRLCPNNCSNHGNCFFNRCKCTDGWTGETCSISPVFSNVTLGIAMAAFVFGVLVLRAVSGCIRPKANNSVILRMGIALLRSFADAIYWIKYASVVDEVVLKSGVALFVLPMVCNVFLTTALFTNEYGKNPDFREFAARFPFTIAIFSLLSSFQAIVMVKCLGSGILGIPQTNAPMSENFWRANKNYGLVAETMQDLPQITLQLYVLARGDVQGAVALVSVLLSTACFLSNCVSKVMLLALFDFKEILACPPLQEVVVVGSDEPVKKPPPAEARNSGVVLDGGDGWHGGGLGDGADAMGEHETLHRSDELSPSVSSSFL
ncbi:hypothetical protein BDK51DRAFT_32550, partial [Blyttiomyces helicus]